MTVDSLRITHTFCLPIPDKSGSKLRNNSGRVSVAPIWHST